MGKQVEIYRAILKEAQAAGLVEQLPDGEDEIEEEGRFFLAEADKAAKSGDKSKVVKAIQNLGQRLGEEEAIEIFGGGTELFRGLPVPENPLHDPTPVPLDLTEVNDKQIRKLHGEYGGYLARARWQLAIAINKQADAANLRDQEYRRAYSDISETLVKENQRATKDLVDSLVGKDKEFVALEEKAHTFSKDVTAYKALVEVYSGYVDRLSREWTMRTEEDKRAY